MSPWTIFHASTFGRLGVVVGERVVRAATERRRPELDLERALLLVARPHDDVLDVLGPVRVALDVGGDRPHPLGRSGDGDGLGGGLSHGVILADGICGDGAFPRIASPESPPRRGRGPNVPCRDAHRPFMPMPNIGTRNPNAERRPGVAVRPVEPGERGDQGDGDLGGEQAVIARRTRVGVAAPVRRYRLATAISSVRLRSMATT